MTETAPGHATMLSGRHPPRPSASRATSSSTRRRATDVYCAEDPSAVCARARRRRRPLAGAPSRADALGDWLKRAQPRAASTRSRGRPRRDHARRKRPDGAYWYRPGAPPRFTTSRYYRDALPPWVETWNGAHPPEDGFLATLPETWEHPKDAPGAAPDDFAGEGERFSRTSPHPLRAGDAERIGEQLFASPFLDTVTLAFAGRLVEAEDLGRGPAPDLLALSLSANDIVGHTYGPSSQEAADALRRLDADLGRLLAALEERSGGRLVVALDGRPRVLPLPEWLKRPAPATCPVAGGRTSALRLGADRPLRLGGATARGSPGRARGCTSPAAQGRVDRALASARGLAPEAVAAEGEGRGRGVDGVERVWTAAEIASGEGELAELYRHSFVSNRSGDSSCSRSAAAALVLRHRDESRLPLRLRPARATRALRRGHRARRAGERAATVDLAPTLAALLGVSGPRRHRRAGAPARGRALKSSRFEPRSRTCPAYAGRARGDPRGAAHKRHHARSSAGCRGSALSRSRPRPRRRATGERSASPAGTSSAGGSVGAARRSCARPPPTSRLATELDLGMARSDHATWRASSPGRSAWPTIRRRVPRAWLGDPAERARCAGLENEIGYTARPS